jgi:acyl dehydratase
VLAAVSRTYAKLAGPRDGLRSRRPDVTVRAVNPDAEGTRYPDLDFTIAPARVEAFRAVFEQTDGVPPTFLTVAEFSVFPQVIADPTVGLDFTRVLHGGQEYELVRPPRVGETLTVKARIDSIRVRGGTGFLTIAMDMFDEAGEPVAHTRSTMIEQAS